MAFRHFFSTLNFIVLLALTNDAVGPYSKSIRASYALLIVTQFGLVFAASLLIQTRTMTMIYVTACAAFFVFLLAICAFLLGCVAFVRDRTLPYRRYFMFCTGLCFIEILLSVITMNAVRKIQCRMLEGEDPFQVDASGRAGRRAVDVIPPGGSSGNFGGDPPGVASPTPVSLAPTHHALASAPVATEAALVHSPFSHDVPVAQAQPVKQPPV